MLRRAALAVGLIALLAAFMPTPASAAPVAHRALQAPCAEMGTTKVAGLVVPTCRRFHPSGAAVRLPADTPAATYGLWNGKRMVTRAGSLRGSGEGWDSFSQPGQVYLRARVVDGVAVDPTPALVVRPSAVLSPLVGLQAVARVQWLSPPDGVTDAPAVLRFPSARTATLATYRRALNVNRKCIAALAGTPATAEAYAPFFDGGRLDLLWFSDMHGPLNSEIVISSPSGPSWMTRGPALIDLLEEPWRLRRVSFSIHASPVGTPASITGGLTEVRGQPC